MVWYTVCFLCLLFDVAVWGHPRCSPRLCPAILVAGVALQCVNGPQLVHAAARVVCVRGGYRQCCCRSCAVTSTCTCDTLCSPCSLPPSSGAACVHAEALRPDCFPVSSSSQRPCPPPLHACLLLTLRFELSYSGGCGWELGGVSSCFVCISYPAMRPGSCREPLQSRGCSASC